ncbi:MAG TPA: PfkB family carbohydrate kinase [Pseudonocardia sp.]|nr:PfkB family carbohydrate kinase [Pseudonocardia sp.]
MPPSTVVVLAPSPILTVTIENRDGEPDIHVHPGGQGVWQARMISSLGVPVVLCAALGGEAGEILGHLIPGENVRLEAVRTSSRNGGYVHDRRADDRQVVAEAPGSALDRHEQDTLYEITLSEGIEAGLAVLSGPQADRVLPTSIYGRLAADLGANGCRVAADLAGERLDAVVEGRPFLVKVSHEELIADGRAKSEEPADLVAAMRTLREEGADTVVVSRAGAGILALVEDEVLEVRSPSLRPAESKGAGDSMTAGMVAAVAAGRSVRDALRTGAACGALNVVHRGLGTGGSAAVETLAERVELTTWKE